MPPGCGTFAWARSAASFEAMDAASLAADTIVLALAHALAINWGALIVNETG